MVHLRVVPSLSLEVVDKQVIELRDEVPPSKNQQFVLLSQQTCQVSTSRLRWVSLCLRLPPLESIQVQFVKVVESCPLVINSSVTSENDDLVLIVSHGVVSSGLRSSDLAHGVLGGSLGLLIGRLIPLEMG